jgi:phytoene synthase
MRNDSELIGAAAEATRRGSKSFYFATRFFPRDLAESAHAVYWFCRITDDIVDENPEPASASVQLEQWRAALVDAFQHERSHSPVLRHFTAACRRHSIPAEYALELIEGMRMDLHCVRYRRFSDLRVFCYRVASTVGLMMSHVIGYEGDALRYAEELGIAMQLTNILRDVKEDTRRGRVYLPLEEMEEFGCSESDLSERHGSVALRNLVRFQSERARSFYRRAMPGIRLLRPEGRFAVVIAANVYRAILDRIAARNYDVLAGRAVVPAWHKWGITAMALAERSWDNR